MSETKREPSERAIAATNKCDHCPVVGWLCTDCADAFAAEARAEALDGFDCQSCGCTIIGERSQFTCRGCGLVVCCECVHAFEHEGDKAHGRGNPADYIDDLRTRLADTERKLLEAEEWNRLLAGIIEAYKLFKGSLPPTIRAAIDATTKEQL